MEYWTIIDDRHAGPYTADELIGMGVKPDSPVWTSGLPDWVEASEIEELRLAMELRDRKPQSPADVFAGGEPAAAAQPVQQEPQPQPAAPAQQAFTQPEAPMQQPYATEPRPMAPAPQSAPQWEWQQEPTVPDEPCPPAYLVWSIIVTILCCQVIGIAAIICSAQTKQAYGRGNIAKAKKMSEWAQWLIIVSIVMGLLALPVQLAFMGI